MSTSMLDEINNTGPNGESKFMRYLMRYLMRYRVCCHPPVGAPTPRRLSGAALRFAAALLRYVNEVTNKGWNTGR
eukprot:496210-Karenia_brevis.AAC.1